MVQIHTQKKEVIKKEDASEHSSFLKDFFSSILVPKVSVKSLLYFTEELETVISSDIPIVTALSLIAQGLSEGRLKKILLRVTDDVRGGKSLSLAMKKHPEAFSPFYTAMIASGEKSGTLSRNLSYLSEQLRRDYDLKKQIVSALTYPAIIIVGMIVLGIVMMVWVVPKLTGILIESGAKLPIPTVILIAVSGFLRSYWYAVILGVLFIILSFRYLSQKESFQKFTGKFLLKVPIFGSILMTTYTLRFSQAMSTLLESGLSIIDAIGISTDIINNEYFRPKFALMAHDIQGGKSFHMSLKDNTDFPPLLIQMVAVGEKSGKTGKMLGKISELYVKDLNNRLKTLVTLLEPLILMVMGIGVGGMVAAIILPIYDLAGTI